MGDPLEVLELDANDCAVEIRTLRAEVNRWRTAFGGGTSTAMRRREIALERAQQGKVLMRTDRSYIGAMRIAVQRSRAALEADK